MNWKVLGKSKTFWSSVSGIIATIGLCAQGAMPWTSAITPILTALVAVFIKDALITQTDALKP